ncbi:MAG: hypothetical protein AMXMBFR12_10450 [Candidatus Babeliales bacterium]
MLNFFKKPFGCVTFLCLFAFVVRIFLGILQISGTGLAIIDWLLPLMGVCLYTIWIYKEKLSAKQILKISLYLYLLSLAWMICMVFLAKVTMNLEFLTFIDLKDIENVKVLLQNFNTTEIMFFSYVIFGFTYLVFSPIFVGIQYLSIKLGNKLGLSFLENI